MIYSFPDQHAAKTFFIDRILARAKEEGTPLSRAGTYQLAWTEVEPGFAQDPQLDVEFEEETDSETYEADVRGLLDRAYRSDVDADPSSRERWLAAYEALRGHDHYILVMIDGALGNVLRKKRRWQFW